MDVATDEQVLQHRLTLEQLRVLKGAGNAEFGNAVGRQPGDFLAVEGDGAIVHVIDAADEIKHCGLARPIRADDAEHLPKLNRERQLAHRLDAAEAHRQVVRHEQRHRSRSVRK